ncbi:hypothetical protein GOBAR_DD04319 [Gossypium barbadense]|nr:hypothetical protein GOBAR_DD04319 [Gossypium barbadense]
MGEDRGIYWFRNYGALNRECTTFKKLVERLINMGVVRFDDSSSAENPLPNHIDNGVDVRAGMGLVIYDSGGNHGKTRNHCDFHHKKGHETQESVKFKALVKGMIDDKEMKLCEEIKEEKNIHIMMGSVHINDIYEDTNEKGPC